MKLNLEKKIALVTGSSKGIGKGIATALLQEGARVAISGRNELTLSATFNELQKQFPNQDILKIQGDLTQASDIDRCLQTITASWGPVDLLCLNLGSGKSISGWDIGRSDWQTAIDANLLAATSMCQAAIPGMIEKKSGNIIFISSITGVESTSAPLPYSAAKAALLSYAKNLSRLLAKDGIRVNSIAPGNILFEGGTWETKLETQPDLTRSYIEENVPLNTFGDPADIGSLASYLFSDVSKFITGSCFVIDGGQIRSQV
ncbi:MAG: 3-oxoacyl-[acyl-carrier protein] reductase [Candidatus Marinamargulisbacteria bacterium]|jgi:3-oxoacyl-[acyl-carrier protein] reductase